MSNKRVNFGGTWTEQKLNILEKYLNAYTTALKNKNFALLYVDAFAGSGDISYSESSRKDLFQDAIEFIEGSASRALSIDDKPFDKLIFVEKDEESAKKLQALKQEHLGRDIEIYNKEANTYLRNELVNLDWKGQRGVLFLDPFATEVEWATIEAIADCQALDMWLLFPTSAVMRMMPTTNVLDLDNLPCAAKLNKVFGGGSWKTLYDHDSSQLSFFESSGQTTRGSGEMGILNMYKRNLKSLFGKRFVDTSRTLMNSRKSPLFEFMFCVGNPKGVGLASRIAKHILQEL